MLTSQSFQWRTLNDNKTDIVWVFFRTNTSSFWTWCTLTTAKISDKTNKFLLNYNYLFWGLLFIGTQCSEYANVTDVYLECLATWKDGSESYLYGQLTSTSSMSSSADSDSNQYRCLVCKLYTTGMCSHSLYYTVLSACRDVHGTFQAETETLDILSETHRTLFTRNCRNKIK